MAVPPYLTSAGRQSILDACRIAGLNCCRLVNETTAIGLFYGLFRSEEFLKSPRCVLFVDVGYSKVTMAAMKFESSRFSVLAQGWESDLGARNLDDAIAQKLISNFQAKHKLDLRKSPKAMIRLYEAVQHAREILSANREAPIIVESIMEDEDIQYNLTREEFEELIEQHLETIKNLCRRVLDESKVEIDAVEMVGETTRTPSIMRVVQECTSVRISRTMNSADCIARGCALQCAMLSPLFKVARYDVVEYNALPVDLVCKLPKSAGMCRAFEEGANFPAEKLFKFESKGNPIEVQLTYPELSQLIRSCKTPNKLHKTHRETVYVRTTLNESMIPSIASIESEKRGDEDLSDGELEDAKANEGRFHRTNTEREAMTDINAEVALSECKDGKRGSRKALDTESEHCGLAEEQVKEFVEAEEKMQSEDAAIVGRKERRNELESYVYEMRGKIGSELKEFVTPSAAKDFLDELGEAENWLFTEEESRSEADYNSKLQALKQTGDPIVQRKRAFEDLNEKANVLDNFIKRKVNCLHTDEECSPDNKQKVYWALNEEADWLDKAKSVLRNSVKTERPPISSEEFDKHIEDVQKITNKIKSRRHSKIEEAKCEIPAQAKNKMENPAKKQSPKRQEAKPKRYTNPWDELREEPMKQNTYEDSDSDEEPQPQFQPQHQRKQRKNKQQRPVRYDSDNSEEEPEGYNPLRRTMQQPFNYPQSMYMGGNRHDEDDDDYVTNLFNPRRSQRRTRGYNPMSSWMPYGLDNAFGSFM
eukprot:TRINITY_DN3180_c0_g1_i16.p1 TRINITY_DN3180_c0_g1~~TRINITY_DN3180_c0_g1_i16.p1  ORF type:complete len:763 (-),score=209.42 TRINITY_DN3180_c0_g1_i16:102-2390(-)